MTENDTCSNNLIFLKDHPKGFIINVFIQPRSSQNKISGIQGAALKLKITAPPVDGAANIMCREYLSGLLKVPKSDIAIISGETGRTKRLLIQCVKEDKKLKIKELLNKILHK